MQADRNQLLKKDRELSAKADSLDVMKASILNYEARMKELELQIQKQNAERNNLELKFEDALQDSGEIYEVHQCDTVFMLHSKRLLIQIEMISKTRFMSWHLRCLKRCK